MLDIKWIKDNQDECERLLKTRGVDLSVKDIISLYNERCSYITVIQKLSEARNEKNKAIANTKHIDGKVLQTYKNDIEHINGKMQELKKKLTDCNKLDEIMGKLPNLPDSDVPYGNSDKDNLLISNWGDKLINQNTNTHHLTIGEKLGMINLKKAAKISGSRFAILLGKLSQLERALMCYMLDFNNKAGFQEISVPYLVKEASMYNAGQLPKFDEDSFKTTNNYRLIPTAEVPLINLVADQIIPSEELPLRFVAASPCFRSEAGAAGKDTRGIIRLHQFNKVELVSITKPEDSKKEHEYLLNTAEKMLQSLKLPYRVMLLCTKDMSFAAEKTYDLEVWMPSQKKYREISSCSNCSNFQARRMKARYKSKSSSTNQFVHTLNSSALPLGRTIAAILENNYDGKTITIPEVLHPYMQGEKKIIVN